MLEHITLRVSNLEKSKQFFTNALSPLGYRLLKEKENSAGYGTEDVDGMRDFWIHEDGARQTSHSFSCLAFKASSKEEVEKFYSEALKNGGTDNGAPDYRPKYHRGYYAAFVFDPDGHNIEAVFVDPNSSI